MGQKLFTSGEFAKFCNTTKDTLFHYDDINLLKPAKIAPNGYRYYSANQAFLFDMISLVMYSHHFRYRLEVGASCSIQLLL